MSSNDNIPHTESILTFNFTSTYLHTNQLQPNCTFISPQPHEMERFSHIIQCYPQLSSNPRTSARTSAPLLTYWPVSLLGTRRSRASEVRTSPTSSVPIVRLGRCLHADWVVWRHSSVRWSEDNGGTYAVCYSDVCGTTLSASSNVLCLPCTPSGDLNMLIKS